MLHVISPAATFKPGTSGVGLEKHHVTPLAPCADVAIAASDTAVWLPPPPYIEPDLRRALAAAQTYGVHRLSFRARPLTLAETDRVLLQSARFRLEAEEPRRLAVALLSRWLEAGSGCSFDISAASEQPLARDALDVLCAALFGRAARSAIGSPALDLRLAVPAGVLPAFRFWPTPADFARMPDRDGADVTDARGAVILGRDAADDPIRLSAEDRMRHLFVLGGTGSGKSTLLLNMIAEDIHKNEAVVLIDPHGDLADAVRAATPSRRRKDIIWVDAGEAKNNWRLDLLALRGDDPDIERNRIANQFVALFRQMYASVPEAMGPCFELYFRSTILLLMEAEDPADRDLIKFEDVLVDESFREKLLAGCKDEKLRQFWEDTAPHVRGDGSLENITPYIINKMTQISANRLTASLISGDKPRLDFLAAMNERKIVIIRLSKGIIGGYNARFLGALFLMSLTEAALGRARIPASERTPCRVFVDEFQTLATQTAAELLAESRKYGLCLTLANQSLSQLTGDSFNPAAVGQAALANCGSVALFRLSLSDALVLASMIEGVSAGELTQLGVGDMVVRRLIRGAPLAAERLRGLAPDHWS
jgi:hypothetical protein